MTQKKEMYREIRKEGEIACREIEDKEYLDGSRGREGEKGEKREVEEKKEN